MITLSLDSALLIYFGIFGVGIIIGKYITQNDACDYRLDLENSPIWQCAICTYIYVDSLHDELSECPRCGSYNDRHHDE